MFTRQSAKMMATPDEWETFKEKAMETDSGDGNILQLKDEYTIIELEGDQIWAGYYPHMEGLYLSHPSNYTYVYPI